MSYYAMYDVTAKCPDAVTAEMVADKFRDELYAEGLVYFSDCTVTLSCFMDIDVEYFGNLTADYPGTFIDARYYGEDREVGVIYAKDDKVYLDSAEVIFPEFDENRLCPQKSI